MSNPAIANGPRGERASAELIAHSERFARTLYAVTEGVWCWVGGGPSNITFVEGPDGLIAIDSGDSCEEAAEALAAVRHHTSSPLVAVIYSHYHYVRGTASYLEDPEQVLEIWGHADLHQLLVGMGAEVGPFRLCGLVHQMGMFLPPQGPDAMPNIGIGPFWRDPDRPTATSGYIPPTHTVDESADVTIAGLRVEFRACPADSDDTLIIWLPDLGVCVNNHLWPALFNVFALRGETYRDPLIRLVAFDHMLALEIEHLVGVHGPPISGSDAVRSALCDYRDSMQFLWDQTVRGMNRGLTLGELIEFVQLPERFEDNYYTRQFYGLVPHHVRQIHGGIRGWFDGDAANLFTLAQDDEARRIVDGFGGRDVVYRQGRDALADGDLTWATQLATYLIRREPDDGDAVVLKADALRARAQSTTSANVRGWCLTQAHELEGTIDLGRFRQHHTSAGRVLEAPPETYVRALRVQLDPAAASDLVSSVQWTFDDGTCTSLAIRGGVAVPGGALADAQAELVLDLDTWAQLYAGRWTAAEAIEAGSLRIEGDAGVLASFFACFDHPHLREAF